MSKAVMANDHGAVELAARLKKHLEGRGIEVVYLGTDKEESVEAELVIMRLTKDGEDYLFETIEDEAEFEKVAAYVESLEDEEYEEE